MNERIEQLAEQCYEDNSTQIDVYKFAELIVRECMDLALAEQMRYANITHKHMENNAVTVSNFRLLMKEHFGVK